MRLRRLAAATLAATLLLIGAGPAAPAEARGCKSFSFKHNGVSWRADSIRVRAVTCRAARTLIKAYAEPRNCQFEPKCRVRRYTCRTIDPEGSEFTERCTRGRRVVRWHGSYVSR